MRTDNGPNSMTCDRARELWEVYSDSEGDSQLYQDVNRHLKHCPSCATWYEKQTQFETGISAILRSETPTPALWARIEGSLPNTKGRFLTLGRVVGGLAACLLLAIAISRFFDAADSDGADLTRLVSACHQRLTTGEEQVQFASESDLDVEAYLKCQVSFPVRCPPRQDAGFEVRGGGVCSVGDSPAAYVYGLVGGGKVSVFILPRERLTDFAQERDALLTTDVVYRQTGAIGMAMAAIDRNLVVVVGQESPEQLERVVRAYGTYPESESHDAA